MPQEWNHRIRRDYCQLTYWDNGAATSENLDWTHVRIEPNIPATWYLEFTPTQTFEIQITLSLLEAAYNSGVYNAKREIREVLGIKDPR